MSAILELSSAVRTRRSDMGLTQTALAKLSGLSRATVNQLENGNIKDLSLSRADRLLGVLGLSVTVTAPRPRQRPDRSTNSSALDLAARTASVSYRLSMNANELRDALSSGALPAGHAPHLYTLLEEAPVSLLARVVEELHQASGIERAKVWKTMRSLAHQLESSRALWS